MRRNAHSGCTHSVFRAQQQQLAGSCHLVSGPSIGQAGLAVILSENAPQVLGRMRCRHIFSRRESSGYGGHVRNEETSEQTTTDANTMSIVILRTGLDTPIDRWWNEGALYFRGVFQRNLGTVRSR